MNLSGKSSKLAVFPLNTVEMKNEALCFAEPPELPAPRLLGLEAKFAGCGILEVRELSALRSSVRVDQVRVGLLC